ncbi:hypothetical protein [Phenylobacterium sp.]|uniref:hypothetical protein n=1 Tax=Phenylobacterium sp. TaxID=1871053 RepID=UPI0028A1452B|nr:hypothetical protein [Phenylobacterium sp.]
MAQQPSISPVIGAETIFEGGPPRRLTALARLPSPIAPNAGVRTMLTLGLGWLPLAVLVAVDIAMGRAGVLHSFVEDIGVHARYAIAAPLLVLAHVVCARRLGVIARHFQGSGLLGEDDEARAAQALEATRRRVHSLWAEAAVLIAVYGQVAALFLTEPAILRQAQWQVAADGAGLSAAGWWHAMVSVPLLLALLLGWAWRIGNWAWFLRSVARLDLRLIAAHPDQSGGLGFLAQSVRAFSIVGMGLGAIVAGRFAYVHRHDLATPYTDPMLMAGIVVLVLAFAVGPLLFFMRPLMQAWRQGALRYGVLATDMGVQFERNWFRGAPGRPMLSEPDFSAATDLYQVVSNVYGMRFVPVDPRSLVMLVAATLAPFVPAMFLSMPAQVVIDELKALLF